MFQKFEEINFVLIIIIGTITFFLFNLGIFLIIKNYQKQLLNKFKEQELLKQQFSKALLQSQIEIQEQTMLQISRELHDNLGQIASLIKIHLNTIDLNDHINTRTKIEESKTLLRQLILDLKFLSISLNSDRIGRIGIQAALKEEVEMINRTGVFNVVYEEDDNIPEIHSSIMTILYRMSQEILNNIVKHSQAKNIHLSFCKVENLVILAITDDGVGFDLTKKMNNKSSGIINLQNRSELIKAILSIDSSPGNGTKITIKLPLQPAYAAAGEDSQTRSD